MAQWERIHLPMQEMKVWSLCWEDLLEEEMATHSSILAWKIPWTEEPGGLQSMGHKELDTTEYTCMRLKDVKVVYEVLGLAAYFVNLEKRHSI